MRAQCLLGHSVVSDSLWLCELKPTRLLCPWDFSGKNTGVGCRFLSQDLTYIWTKVPTELLSSILHYIFLKSMVPYFITLSFHIQQFGIELFPHFYVLKVELAGLSESWTIKKAEHQRNDAFWTVVLEKTLESPLDGKEIKLVNPKGNQSCVFIGRTDAKAEAPILCSPDAKNWLIWKDPDSGKDWRQEEKGTTEDEMVGWHHWLDGCEFEQAPGVGDG